MKKPILVAALIIGALAFLLFVLNQEPGAQQRAQSARLKTEMAERQAIEDQAEAGDVKMDAIAAAGKVKIGMTAAQCRAALGKPESITRTKSANGILEQWIYNRNSLYFQNGILRVIRD